uniref:Uncharacterized protein n=1 Tax=Arundo donax TaxID=35708 RepID=A0A0A9F3D5_ARUDO
MCPSILGSRSVPTVKLMGSVYSLNDEALNGCCMFKTY